MRKGLSFAAAAAAACLLFASGAQAQNTSPYWSLDGNSNASGASSKLGTTNNVPVRLFTNNLERMRIASNGNIGIGIVSPPAKLTVQGSGGVPAGPWVSAGTPIFSGFGENTVGNADYILSMASNTALARPVFIGRRGRGTLAAPAAVQNNDYLTSFLASGFDGSSFLSPATVDFFVDGPVAVGSVPGRISFSTGSNLATRQERLKIGSTGNIDFNNGQLYVRNSDGNVGLGTLFPSQKLTVAGNGLFIGRVGVNGGLATGYALNVNAGSGLAGINVSDPQDDYVLRASKSGLLSGIYVTKTSGTSFDPAVWGQSTGSSIGVQGSSNSNYGVYGNSVSDYGVYGTSSSSYAGYFVSANYRGLYAESDPLYFAGYFNGGVYTTGTYSSSDARLKKNIQDVDRAMDIINKLQPKHYEFRSDGDFARLHLPKGNHYGLLAQDVEKVLPELVKDAGIGARDGHKGNTEVRRDGAGKAAAATEGTAVEFKAVNYTELIPILIKAMQEQQAELESLREEVSRLSKGQTTGAALGNASLGQATPNPANGNTSISYSLPQGVRNARLLVTDNMGRALQSVPLGESGVVQLNTAMLSSGVYNYSLVVDNRQIATRKMTVVK